MTSLSKPSKFPSLLSYVNLVHAIAGGCGSAFAMTTFYPLDIVRTRLQLEDGRKSRNTFVTLADIYQQEGIYGLYRGLLPVIQSLYCSNFVYFYAFHALKSFSNKEKSALKDLLFGMVAGCINVLMTTPLWVVNTRIKMQGLKQASGQERPKRYKGLLHGLIKISREEGVGALWSGTLSSLLLVINPAIQFMTYEALKRRAEKLSNGAQMSVMMAFLAGAAAKSVATFLTYPLQLVQAKQRHGHNYPGLPEKAGIIQLILYIIKLQGVKGLFKGLEAKVLQTVSTAALMFVFYEKITFYVFSLLMRTKSVPKR